ncbi:MAG: PGN_0703 family putative restriction endonuclease, partial [Pseudonocardiaceae bacterium]
MTTGHLYRSAEEAFLPEALGEYQNLQERGVTHRWVLAAHSSQAFALNLFAPLDAESRRGVFGLLGTDVASVDRFVFEWSDEADRLGEGSSRSRHLTQVDVLLRGTTTDGERVVALIEVKLTESDFGWCSAYENPSNPKREVCRRDGLFGGEPDGCFQIAYHGNGHRRDLQYIQS